MEGVVLYSCGGVHDRQIIAIVSWEFIVNRCEFYIASRRLARDRN